MNLPNPETLFHTKSGVAFPGVSLSALAGMRKALFEHYGLSMEQAAEGAAFSMAMVARSALALSAKDAMICVLASDTLSGGVVVAALRHIVCAGGQGHVCAIGSPSSFSASFERQLAILDKMGVPIDAWDSEEKAAEFSDLLSASHAAMLGLFEPLRPLSNVERSVISALNESTVPVHTIDCPAGVDPETGASDGSPIFASSTLSLGSPLLGLNPGSEYVGRHYLCDISFDASIYRLGGMNLCSLFAEQPVIQIFPVKPQSPDSEPKES